MNIKDSVVMFISIRFQTVIFFLLFSSLARASSFKELQFLPKKGTNIIGIGVSSLNSKEDIEVHAPGNQKNDFYKVAQDYQWLSFDVGHSFTNRLYVALSFPYSIYNREVTKYLEGSTIEGEKFGRNMSGVGDPTISGKQRMLVQLSNVRLNIDTVISYSPSTGDKEVPSTSKSGNIKRGGDAYALKIEVGNPNFQFPNFQFPFAFYGTIRYFDQTKGKDLFDDSSVSTKPFHSKGMGGQGQLKIRENIYIVATLEFGKFNTQTIQNLGNKSEISSKRYSNYILALKYIFNDRILWNLKLDHYYSAYSLSSSSLSMEGKKKSDTLNTEILFEF